jgi:SAM-dependent methyltransferase
MTARDPQPFRATRDFPCLVRDGISLQVKEEDSAEWSGFTGSGSRVMACKPWRDYCDALHAKLLSSWLGGRRFGCSLKTDLFDESVGTGCLGALASVSEEVHGIDISRQVVESAGAGNPRIKTLLGDVRDMPYAKGSFDLVFSNSTIDHFATRAEIEQSIGEMARVLGEKGTLILTMDNPRNPMVGLRNFLPQKVLQRTGLVPYFMGQTLSMREMVRSVEAAGLRVVRCHYIQHVPRVFALHLCRILAGSQRLSDALPRAMLGWEALAAWPSAAWTGYYSAVLAVKE